MPVKKLLVVHDAIGRIVSVGQVHSGAYGNMGIMPAPGHTVLEIDVTGDLAEKPLVDLHHLCVVDLKSGTLARRGEKGR